MGSGSQAPGEEELALGWSRVPACGEVRTAGVLDTQPSAGHAGLGQTLTRASDSQRCRPGCGPPLPPWDVEPGVTLSARLWAGGRQSRMVLKSEGSAGLAAASRAASVVPGSFRLSCVWAAGPKSDSVPEEARGGILQPSWDMWAAGQAGPAPHGLGWWEPQ